MNISELKKENDIAVKNLSPQCQKTLEKALENVSKYTINNLDYEKVRMDLIGLFQETQLRGEDPNHLFSKPEEVEFLCNELRASYKSQSFIEKVVNALPTASLSSLLYGFISLIIFNSMPSIYLITPFDLIFWFVVAPFISILYRHFSYNIKNYYIKFSFMIGNLCIAAFVCYLSIHFEMVIYRINSYILILILIIIYAIACIYRRKVRRRSVISFNYRIVQIHIKESRQKQCLALSFWHI